MRHAWVYASDRDSASEIAHALAELGFSPRFLERGNGLRPSGRDGAEPERPSLVVVVAGSGERPPTDLLAAFRAAEDLRDVGVLLAVESEHLRRAEGLALADELLVRPFSREELDARVARAAAADAAVESPEFVRVGTLEINLATYQVAIEGKPISFAYMEYELLKFLVMHPNRVFPREALLSRVWGYDYYGGARTVDVHIRRLRAKLGQEHAARIKTIRNVGYLFDSNH